MQVVYVTPARLRKLPPEIADQVLRVPNRSDAQGVKYEGQSLHPDRVKLAKAYAATKQHEGRIGGWIYSSTGRVLAQGWLSYYLIYWQSIYSYYRRGA